MKKLGENIYARYIQFSNRLKPIAKDPFGKIDIEGFNQQRNLVDRGKLCHAPFKSLRFEQKGVVRVCCFNDMVEIGKYPNVTLKDIWHSEQLKVLRNKIKTNDLSYGCELCAQQLINKEYSVVKILQFDDLPFDYKGYPQVLDFSIQNTCNLECVMCTGIYSSLIRKNREKLPPIQSPYDEAFVAQLRDFIPHARRFIFAGGEPFLIGIYYDIWEDINRLNPSADVHVVTNGTVLNKRGLEILKKGRFNITHSIDSFNKETYEAIRINASFDEMRANQEFLINYCKEKGTTYSVNICPIQQNWWEIPEMLNYCNENDIPVNLLSVTYPPNSTLMTFPSDKLQEVVEVYEKASFKEINDLDKRNIGEFKDLISRVKSWYEKALMEDEHGPYNSRKRNYSDSYEGELIGIDEVLEVIKKQLTTGVEAEDRSGEVLEDILRKLEGVKDRFNSYKFRKDRLSVITTADREVLTSSLSTQNEEEIAMLIRDHIL